MVITITLNPCIDKSLVIDTFTYGGLNKVLEKRTDAAGKGINVSIVLNELGVETLSLGFNFSANGELITNRLDACAVPYDFVSVDGEVRTNIKLFENKTKTMTEINERGGFVGEAYVSALIEKISRTAGNASNIYVMSGSAPAGIGVDIYRKLTELLRGHRVIVDADGALLSEAVKAKPYAIKPNLFELQNAFGLKTNSHSDIIATARKIIDGGVEIVLVSMGADGAMLVSRDEAFFAPAPDVDVKGQQGAGDSMVAGMCYALEKNLPTADILKCGVACAAGSVSREGTLLCDRALFEEMYRRVDCYEAK